MSNKIHIVSTYRLYLALTVHFSNKNGNYGPGFSRAVSFFLMSDVGIESELGDKVAHKRALIAHAAQQSSARLEHSGCRLIVALILSSDR